jgi:hypothetical protein
MTPEPADTPALRSTLTIVVTCGVIGALMAVLPAFVAGLALCGISGCSGAGYGRASDPGATREWLSITAVAFTLPFVVAAFVTRRRSVVIAATVVALLSYPVAATLVGARLNGCPADIPCTSGPGRTSLPVTAYASSQHAYAGGHLSVSRR